MNRTLRRRSEKFASKPPLSSKVAQTFSEGVRLHLAGKLDEACAAYKTVVALQPDHAEAHYSFGLALHNQGQLDRAIDCYRRAVACNPRYALALNNLALVFKQIGRLEEAEAACLKALAIVPASPMFLANLGAVLIDRGEFDRAAEVLQKAVAIDPANASPLASLCNVLRQQGRTGEAIAVGRRAVALQPNFALAQHNLAVALSHADEVEESLARFKLVTTLDPSQVEAHMAVAFASLARGDYARGWNEYEWRWQWRQHERALLEEAGLLATPRWSGDELSDKTLMICAEQGLGDTIQFSRYLPLVLRRAKRVILWIQPTLKALFQNVEGVTLRGMDEPTLGVNVYCPLLSLPHIFATTPQTIPPVAPYFKAPPAAAERWRRQLGQNLLNVGICWQGKPATELDKGRSFPLASMAPLARIPGVRLISLQKHFGTEQIANLPAGMTVETLGDDFDAGSGAFVDTAAMMETLDLVVTSDTAIAHLAGSLGRPTWLVLQRAPDWRWGIGSTNSPWYPSMRLFRQTTSGDWHGLFREIAAALAPWVVEARRGKEADLGAD